MKNKTPIPRICACFFFITIFLNNAKIVHGQVKEYRFRYTKLESFAPNFYSGSLRDNIEDWAKANEGERIQFNESGLWCPDGIYYVVYTYRSTSYWFGPGPSYQWQIQALNNLRAIKQRLAAIPDLTDEAKDVFVFPVTIFNNNCLRPGYGMGNVVDEQMTADLFRKTEFLQAIERRLGKINDIKFDFSLSDNGERPPETDEQRNEELDYQIDQLYGHTNIMGQLYEELLNNGFINPQVNKLFNDLKKEYGDKAKGKNSARDQAGKQASGANTGKKDGKGGKGAKVPFKIKTPFSEWFVTLLRAIAKYLGIEELAKQVLLVAYMVAPELFDYIGSYLATLQQALTPKSFDEFLNNTSRVFQYALDFMEYMQTAYQLLTDPRLLELSQQLDMRKILEQTQQIEVRKILQVLDRSKIVDIPDWMNSLPLQGVNFANLSKLQLHQAAEKIKNFAVTEAINRFEQQLRKSGIPIIQNLDLRGLEQAAKDGKLDKFVQNHVGSSVINMIPAEYREAAIRAINGDVYGAAIEQASREFNKHTGVPLNDAKELLGRLGKNDLKGATEIAFRTQTHRLGEYKRVGDLLVAGQFEQAYKEAGFVAMRGKVPENVRQGFMNNGPAGALSAYTKGMLSVEDIKSILAGEASYDLLAKAKQIASIELNMSPEKITPAQIKNWLTASLNKYAQIAETVPSGVSPHPADYFSPYSARTLAKLLNGFEASLPELRNELRLKELFGGFKPLAQEIIEQMQRTNSRLVQHVQQLVQQRRYDEAWLEIARTEIQRLPSELSTVAAEILNGLSSRSAAELADLSEKIALQIPELGPGKIWWAIMQRRTGQTEAVLAKYMGEWDKQKGVLINTLAGAIPGLNKQLAADIIAGKAPEALESLLLTAARNLGIQSDDAIRALAHGDFEQALIQTSKNAPIDYATEANQLAQNLYNRLIMFKELLKAAKLQLSPEKVDEIMVKMRMVSRRG
ncbi:MAG: hypothetical protein ILNGONEN_00200 [Syntrophorhabdaceae bacterium]|nr:hypothetical protein [Syntrophorhabdaceae bacterium]